jgi:hypothetical protein
VLDVRECARRGRAWIMTNCGGSAYPTDSLATAIRRRDSNDVVLTHEQHVKKRRWLTPGVLWRATDLSSDKPWCPRMTKASHDASGGRCHEGESRFLTCMSASRRGGTILQSRTGTAASVRLIKLLTYLLHRMSIRAARARATGLEHGRVRAAVALWRPHFETSRWMAITRSIV